MPGETRRRGPWRTGAEIAARVASSTVGLRLVEVIRRHLLRAAPPATSAPLVTAPGGGDGEHLGGSCHERTP